MLKLHVVTPEGQALDQEADEVTVPGLLGEFGVLPGHVPLLAATQAGALRYRKGNERGRMAIGPGFCEVDGKDLVIVLVQKALPAERIQRDGAEKLLLDAESRLAGKDANSPSLASDVADKAWAQAMLDTLKATT